MKYYLAIKKEPATDTHKHKDKPQKHHFEQKEEVRHKQVYIVGLYLYDILGKSQY